MQFLRDFGRLIKFKVNLVVVLSAVFGYLIGAANGDISFWDIFGLSMGGFFTTGAAHAINQLYESKFDALMPRTNNRPLPTGRMSRNQVILMTIGMTLLGAFFFAYFTNMLTFIVGMLSLLIYAFIYTPMKRVNAIAVFIGAIPGALPPMIGFIAATNQVTDLALLLFLVQFVWQFPHFWSIAWIYHHDYHRAGYHLLPFKNGRTKKNALATFLSAILLIPSLLFFYLSGFLNVSVAILILMLTLWFIYRAYIFYKDPNLKRARKLMLGSVIYLPILQIILVILFISNSLFHQ